MRLRTTSLRGRVAAGAVVATLVVVTLVGLLVASRTRAQELAQVDHELQQRAAKVASDVGRLALGDTPGVPNDSVLGAASQTVVRLLDGDRLVAEHGTSSSVPAQGPVEPGLTTIDGPDGGWRSVVVPVPASTAQVQVLQSLDPVDERVAALTRTLLAGTLAAALLTGAAVWWLTGPALRPLDRLRHNARRVRDEPDASGPWPRVDGPREVVELSTTIGQMLDAMRASAAATRRFTADAGHELRNPLTSIGADLETLSRHPDLPPGQRAAALAAVRAEHARVVAVLDGLQTLARGDAGALPSVEQVDVVALVDEAVAAARRAFPGVTVQWSPPAQDVTIAGWPTGLRIVVDNLLRNAATHAAPPVVVAVEVDDAVRLSVTDAGPGLSDADKVRVLDRFARGPAAQGDGSGLGLAIVAQQVALHGGTFTLVDAPQAALGQTGTAAVVVLPRRSPQQCGRSASSA